MDTRSLRTQLNVQLSTLPERHRQFIEDLLHCALCGERLEIKVESYLEDHMIREEANCHKCHVKTRSKNHRMQ